MAKKTLWVNSDIFLAHLDFILKAIVYLSEYQTHLQTLGITTPLFLWSADTNKGNNPFISSIVALD